MTTFGNSDPTVQLWDTRSGRHLRTFSLARSFIDGGVFSPDGRTVVTSEQGQAHTPGGEVTLRFWDAQTGNQVRNFQIATAYVRTFLFSPDGNAIVTSNADQTVRLMDAQTGTELRRFVGHSAQVGSMAFSPDGKLLLTGSDNRTARLWDSQTGKQLLLLSGHTRTPNVAFSSNGRFVLTADDTARLWDLQLTNGLIGHTAGITAVGFSPDGKNILTTSEDGTARVWDANTRKEAHRYTDVNELVGVSGNMFSPDSKYALTMGGQLRRFTSVIGVTKHVAISPDGKRLVAAGDDPTVRLWNLDTRDMIASICARLPRDLTADERSQYGIADNQPTCQQGAQAAPTGTPQPGR